jgi:CRISPR-associated protein Csd1
MGFWQHLVESYEKNAEALKKSYPLSTTTISNNSDIIAVVVINGEGKFRECEVIPKRPTGKRRNEVPLVRITIPVTEKSMGRASGPCPHPVFDQFGYLKGKGKKFDLYIAQLARFAESSFATEQVKAIYEYIKKKSLASDLSETKLKDKTNIIFKVEVAVGDPQSKVWENESFFAAWHQFYLSEKKQAFDKKVVAGKKLSESNISSSEKKELRELVKSEEQESIDYISGCSAQLVAIFHPKKLSNGSANSKLVSDNDKSNYTFRGKFTSSSDAISIGYDSSQKAHQFLRYLINERGFFCGEQVIFSYTIGSVESEVPPPIEEKSMWNLAKSISVTTEKDAEDQLRATTGFDYADSLRKSLAGYGINSANREHAQTAVVALDAATTGRLSITFYRELARDEYLEKIACWHDQGKWHQKFWDKENEKYVPFIGAPSVDRIIEAVHGKPRGTKDESYTKIKKGARERLLRCIFDEADIPFDYVRSAVCRASNPLSITRNGKFNRHDFNTVLSTACALVRRDHQQRNQEVYEMSIELERTDRDYLYGRLLGAADNLEEYALYKKSNDRVVTAALRHMQAFARRPFSTWTTIHGCLNPYIQQVKGSFGFSEIKSIKQQFEEGQYENDAPLGGAYLLGYYHELAHIDELVKEHPNKGE